MWPETAIKAKKETAPLFMERLMVAHIFTKADENIAGTVVESAFDATDYKLQLP